MADQPILNTTARLLELQECAGCEENSQEKKVDFRVTCGGAGDHAASHKILDEIDKGLTTKLGKRVSIHTED